MVSASRWELQSGIVLDIFLDAVYCDEKVDEMWGEMASVRGVGTRSAAWAVPRNKATLWVTGSLGGGRMQTRGNYEGNAMHVDAHVEGRWKQIFGTSRLQHDSGNDAMAESESKKVSTTGEERSQNGPINKKGWQRQRGRKK